MDCELATSRLEARGSKLTAIAVGYITTTNLPYINQRASTSTMICVRGIFWAVA
jgi:hypothetical protein